MDSMYEFLMELPLFKGVGFDKISEIIGTTKFHFLKYLEGETIVSAGDPCTHIRFVISGAARLTTVSSDSRMRVCQTLTAPDVIAPDFLFGRFTNYPATAVAIDRTSILQLTKNDYLKILHSDKVFLINFLNTISINAQKSVIGVLALTHGTLEERIAFWIAALTQRGSTDITLQCKQRDIYSLFGVQRSSFINTLDSMQERGLLEYDQREIRFNSRPALIELLTNPQEE